MVSEIEHPIFLGVCESALIRGEGVSQDFYGVSDVVAMPFFPQSLKGLFLLLGFPKTLVDKQVRITISSKERPDQKGWADLHTSHGMGDRQQIRLGGFAKHDAQEGTWLLLYPGMPYKPMPIMCPPLFVPTPCEINVVAEIEGHDFQIGAFRCEFCQPPPISLEERAAIMSGPNALNTVIFGMQCNKCKDKVEYYLPLDQKSRSSYDKKGSIFLPTASDVWECKCSASKLSLTYLKQGVHELFRRGNIKPGRKELKFIPLYQRGAIAAIKTKYQKILVDCANDEESVQKFIEANPILWNFLAPTRIWKKPPILTKHKADFGILTVNRVLYFIEIEKPSTKLVTKRGHISAALQVGLDQSRNWQIEIEKRREAVLDGLGLTQQDIHDIRYILIAGMTGNTSLIDMEKIRRMRDPCFIFTFDELASFLHCTEIALLNV